MGKTNYPDSATKTGDMPWDWKYRLDNQVFNDNDSAIDYLESQGWSEDEAVQYLSHLQRWA